MIAPPVPSLLWEGEWIPSMQSYGRDTLAEIVYAQRNSIFPEHHVHKFELSLAQHVEEPLGVDLVLISTTYDAWHLVFVEPTQGADVDSLVARVQTITLLRFGVREARYLESCVSSADKERIRPLLNESPRFLVVTDSPRHGWSKQLGTANVEADIMVVEPFRHGDTYILRVNGGYPAPGAHNVVGICHDYTPLANCLEVTWTSDHEPPSVGALVIRYGSVETRWEVLPGQPSHYLIGKDEPRLPVAPPLHLVQESDGRYSFSKP